jgi:F-type H+-transporting ATPase subunit epsilon
MQLDISILSTSKVIYKGQAKSVIVPGEGGVFEILPFHKRIMSRLVSGVLIVDGQPLPIKRGIIKAAKNHVTIILEEV